MARVVPTALKMTVGVGVRVVSRGPHLVVSGSWMASSLGESDSGLGSRREMVLMEVNLSLVRRVLRMLLPTAPVQPNTAAVVMFGL